MFLVVTSCILLVALTSAIHYEALGLINAGLPALRIPVRTKLLVVIFGSFLAHIIEIAIYGIALYSMIHFLGVGTLSGSVGNSFFNCLYFSAETYTSLGFGDLTPTGPVRMLVGVEALNGLLLIGWSATFTHIAMERFWNGKEPVDHK